jgi:hypothetical protein
MAKGKGKCCPGCGQQTFHDRGPVRICSKCRYVGWEVMRPVNGVGKGKGETCPNCEVATFHKVYLTRKTYNSTTTKVVKYQFRRCSTCGYAGVQPLIGAVAA